MTNFYQLGLSVLEAEAEAIHALARRLDHHFEAACQLLLSCKGRIIVTGMGKSGHIGRKIAATLASTGTPSFFVHPGEASHGDMGMITADDLLLAISHSGQTTEIIALIPHIKRLNIPMIALTGQPNALIARNATLTLDVSVTQEACPFGLAPTTSTTTALAMGDALAIALLQARGFTAEDFARSHPGGTLGKKSLLTIQDIWETGEALPTVPDTATVHEALIEVSEKKLGMTCVLNSAGQLVGIYTDGDIRRTLMADYDIKTTRVHTVMSPHYLTIERQALASEALARMQEHHVTALIIQNEHRSLEGIVHIHHLLRAGVI